MQNMTGVTEDFTMKQPHKLTIIQSTLFVKVRNIHFVKCYVISIIITLKFSVEPSKYYDFIVIRL